MIYSIGYGGRQPEELIALLKRYNIKLLIDVRRKAFCKWNATYCGDGLSRFCSENGIKYVHRPELGGSKKKDDAYFEAIYWLKTVVEPSALMCCEKHYFRCHRYHKIGNELAGMEMQVKHITANGGIYCHPLQFAASSRLSNL